MPYQCHPDTDQFGKCTGRQGADRECMKYCVPFQKWYSMFKVCPIMCTHGKKNMYNGGSTEFQNDQYDPCLSASTYNNMMLNDTTVKIIMDKTGSDTRKANSNFANAGLPLQGRTITHFSTSLVCDVMLFTHKVSYILFLPCVQVLHLSNYYR